MRLHEITRDCGYHINEIALNEIINVLNEITLSKKLTVSGRVHLCLLRPPMSWLVFLRYKENIQGDLEGPTIKVSDF
jgi:hypothetical protein